MNDKIMLIDAYAQIYRGFYGVRNLTNSRGEPVNALFAIMKLLLKMHKYYPTKLGCFAFDKGKPAFRLGLAPDYKAGRPPMPDELKLQIEGIREIIKLFGWKIVENEKLEADDIVALIAKKFTDYDVEICSADKDIAQVTTDRIKMLIPDKNSPNGLKLQGPQEVIDRFGIRANQIIDYLSLLGDNADNIPGVQGVGAKTAVKLLLQFDTIENMLNNINEISNLKLRGKIANSIAILDKNKQLISLKTDIDDMQWDNVENIIRSEPNWQGIAKFAEENELKSILREIEKEYMIEEKDIKQEKHNDDFDLFSFSNDIPQTDEKNNEVQETPEPEDSYYTPDLF